jgi:hypothetical protein
VALVEREDRELGWRPAEERGDEEKLVGRLRGEHGRRRTCAPRLGEARRDLERAAAPAGQRPGRRDPSAGDEEALREPVLRRGSDEAELRRAQALELAQLGDDALEGRQAVAKTGRVLLAERLREPPQPRAQPG